MSDKKAQLIVGGLGFFGIIIAAVIGYWAAVQPKAMEISATQTAESKLTAIALAASRITDVSGTPAINPSATRSSASSITIGGTPTISNTIMRPTQSGTPLLILPLEEVFPQVGEGEEFHFVNSDKPDAIKWRFQTECRHSGLYGLEIIYGFIGEGNGGWGVRWDTANKKHFDASGFDTLTFWVKRGSITEKFQIGLKDKMANERKVESDVFLIDIRDWILVSIPLSRFRGVNTQFIDNLNFGFNSNHGSGAICIDDIAFVRR